LNKKELVDAIAATAELNKATAEKVLDGTLDAIGKALGKGDTITLVGFGSFSISQRGAREGRNPQNGKTIQIPAKKVIKFSPGKHLSGSVNG
jgi:DNA-binding protein HU-beta